MGMNQGTLGGTLGAFGHCIINCQVRFGPCWFGYMLGEARERGQGFPVWFGLDPGWRQLKVVQAVASVSLSRFGWWELCLPELEPRGVVDRYIGDVPEGLARSLVSVEEGG
jgi:hypothetical protein